MATSVVHAFKMSAFFLSFTFAARTEDSEHIAFISTQPDLEVKQFAKGNWTFDKATRFKKFYENDAYPDLRIAVFKDSEPGKLSEDMKDEMDALSKMRGWKQLGPDNVVKVDPVDVTENGQVLQAMAIEWIDGDFFDIAKIHKTAYAQKRVLLIAARVNAHDEKVDTSEVGFFHVQTPSSTTLNSANVQKKIRYMYESLAKIKEVENKIVDLQVIVRTNGMMVVIDPYGVDESPPQPSNNLLGAHLGVGPTMNNPATAGAKWAKFDRGTQTRNINAALAALQNAYQSPQDLPKPKSQTSNTLTVY